MKFAYGRVGGVLLTGVALIAGTLASGPTASAAPVVAPTLVPAQVTDAPSWVSHDRVVSDVPASWTPHVLNGTVSDLAQIGNVMVAGGQFSQVAATPNAPAVTRNGVVAFDATTGTISTTFNPVVANGAVMAVAEGPLPNTVYVAGSFTSVNGVNRKIVLLDVNSGAIVSSFNAPAMNGLVRDIVKVGDRLYVGGAFTLVGPQPHGGLVALDATTGARLDFLNVDLTEHHNYTGQPGQAQAPVGARAIAVDPAETTLAVVGNFRKADGLDRRQMVLIDLTGPTAQVRPDWRTRRYEPACFSNAFDTYMRAVNFSPDGEYVVVASTGGPNPGTLCDTAARFDINAVGDSVQPTWVDDTGGDTLLSISSSGAAVYAGGHQRWQNNHGGRDSQAPGAVPRPGLAGIDPSTGLPISWNPGRHPRGAGAEAVVVTTAGLWVGSDTEWIGNRDYRRSRIAFFPVAGGYELGAGETGALPSNVYVATGSAGLTRAWYEGGAVDRDFASAPGGEIDWASVRGATVVDGELFYLTSSGMFLRRTFDGTTYGPPVAIDPYNDAYWSDISTSSGGRYFRGLQPSFYGQINSVRGLAYESGRIYYTRTGMNQLYSRSFQPDSGIMSQAVVTVPGFTASSLGEIFIDPAGGHLYFVNTNSGNLSRIVWDHGSVSGSAVVVSGPAIDGVDWRSSAAFLADGPEPPQAAAVIEASCAQLVCNFDGSSSSGGSGAVVSYAWDFGDGAVSSDAVAQHTYAAPGEYSVTLTVTSEADEIGSAVEVVVVSDVVGPSAAVLVGQSAVSLQSGTGRVSLPAGIEAGDVVVLFVATSSGSVTSGPSGVGAWVLADQTVSGPLTVSTWTRVADGSESGQEVTFASSESLPKWDLTALVYRGVGSVEVVESVVSAGATSHVSPLVSVAGGQRRVVTYWAERSSVTSSWSAPDGVTVLSTQSGTGGGRVATLVADAVAEGGSYGGLTATTSVTTGRGASLTLVLAP